MNTRTLAVVVVALLAQACATVAGGVPKSTRKTPADQHTMPAAPSLSATFETTAANRAKARDKGQPVLLRGNAVVYPPGVDQKRTGSGWVYVSMTIRADGTVSDVGVISRSNPVFDRAAMDAVRSWVFEPLPAPRSIAHRVFIQATQTADHYQPSGAER